MKKSILIIFLFSGVFGLNAQEIDYNELASIFKKSADEAFISQLKKVANKKGGKNLLNDLMNVNSEIQTLTDRQNAKTAVTTREVENIKSQLKRLRDKGKTAISESKRLANKRDDYKSLAKKAANNYYKYSSLGGANRYIRDEKKYVNKANYYNRKLRIHNNSIDLDELRRQDKRLVRKANNMLTNNKTDINETSKKVKSLQSKRYDLKNEVYQMMLAKTLKKFRERNNPVKEKKASISKFSSKMIPKNELASWIKIGDNLQTIKDAANAGKAYAQRRLARIYNYVKKDRAKGLYWRKKAANNGDAISQSNLGFDYHFGESGMQQNYKEAVKWYRKSALQGHKFGQHNLAVMFENGLGVKKDYYIAEVWYRKAAKQGYMHAQNSLGYMYEKGTGVIKNFKEAIKWYRKAANQGLAIAENNLGDMYYYGRGVAKNYREAVKWYHKAANQGNASAQYSLGYMYNHGEGVTKNRLLAIKWYKKAVKGGSNSAKKDLKKLGVE